MTDPTQTPEAPEVIAEVIPPTETTNPTPEAGSEPAISDTSPPVEAVSEPVATPEPEPVAPEVIVEPTPEPVTESVLVIPASPLTAAQVSAIQYLTGDFSEPLSEMYVGKQCYDDGTLGSPDAAPISLGLAMMVGSRNEERLGMRRDVACGVMLNRADF